MLSDRDIKRELIKAKNMAIYPLKLENINGSSVNLTASKYAWKISDGSLAIYDNETKIIIPEGETVSILTNEAIWVSRKISGTYHSRVSLSAKGLSNISTTLDPQWRGLSLISLTNTSNKLQELKVGDGIVTLTFTYLNTPATKEINETVPSRTDIFSKFDTTKYSSYLESPKHRSVTKIKKQMIGTEEYKELKNSTLRMRLWYILNQPLSTAVIGIGGVIIGVIIGKIWN